MALYRITTTVEATVTASSEEMARQYARQAALANTFRVRPLSIHGQNGRPE